MKQWINIATTDSEVTQEAIAAFAAAAQSIGLYVVGDPDFPELICIYNKEERVAMQRKLDLGCLEMVPVAPEKKLAVA